jgi:ribosomal protein L28
MNILNLLKELYDNYHRDMQIYDNYKDGDEIHDSETSDGNQTIDFAKKLNACRKYISVNLKMVETSAEMDSKKKLEVCEAIKSKMDTLESLGAHLTDKIISRFNNVVSSTQNDLSEQQTERANTDKISEDESKES